MFEEYRQKILENKKNLTCFRKIYLSLQNEDFQKLRSEFFKNYQLKYQKSFSSYKIQPNFQFYRIKFDDYSQTNIFETLAQSNAKNCFSHYKILQKLMKDLFEIMVSIKIVPINSEDMNENSINLLAILKFNSEVIAEFNLLVNLKEEVKNIIAQSVLIFNFPFFMDTILLYEFENNKVNILINQIPEKQINSNIKNTNNRVFECKNVNLCNHDEDSEYTSQNLVYNQILIEAAINKNNLMIAGKGEQIQKSLSPETIKVHSNLIKTSQGNLLNEGLENLQEKMEKIQISNHKKNQKNYDFKSKEIQKKNQNILQTKLPKDQKSEPMLISNKNDLKDFCYFLNCKNLMLLKKSQVSKTKLRLESDILCDIYSLKQELLASVFEYFKLQNYNMKIQIKNSKKHRIILITFKSQLFFKYKIHVPYSNGFEIDEFSLKMGLIYFLEATFNSFFRQMMDQAIKIKLENPDLFNLNEQSILKNFYELSNYESIPEKIQVNIMEDRYTIKVKNNMCINNKIIHQNDKKIINQNIHSNTKHDLIIESLKNPDFLVQSEPKEEKTTENNKNFVLSIPNITNEKDATVQIISKLGRISNLCGYLSSFHDLSTNKQNPSNNQNKSIFHNSLNFCVNPKPLNIYSTIKWQNKQKQQRDLNLDLVLKDRVENNNEKQIDQISLKKPTFLARSYINYSNVENNNFIFSKNEINSSFKDWIKLLSEKRNKISEFSEFLGDSILRKRNIKEYEGFLNKNNNKKYTSIENKYNRQENWQKLENHLKVKISFFNINSDNKNKFMSDFQNSLNEEFDGFKFGNFGEEFHSFCIQKLNLFYKIKLFIKKSHFELNFEFSKFLESNSSNFLFKMAGKGAETDKIILLGFLKCFEIASEEKFLKWSCQNLK